MVITRSFLGLIFLCIVSTHRIDGASSFTLAKTVSAPTVSLNSTFTFTITVSNTGTNDITNLSVTDAVQLNGNAALAIQGVTTSNLGTPTVTTLNDTVSLTNGYVTAGTSGTVVITVLVPCTAALKIYPNTASATAIFSDKTNITNYASVQYTIATIANFIARADCSGNIIITGTTSAGNRVTATGKRSTGGSVSATGIVANSGNFSVVLPATNGNYTSITTTVYNPTNDCSSVMTVPSLTIGAATLTGVSSQVSCSPSGNTITITGQTSKGTPTTMVTIAGDLSGTAQVNGNGQFTAKISNVANGTYNLVVVAVNPATHCTQEQPITVTVGVSPQLAASEFACLGTSVTLTATPGFATYQFFANGNALSGPQGSHTFTVTPTKPTQYTVKATNTKGCSGMSNAVAIGNCALLTIENCCTKTLFANAASTFVVTVRNTGATTAQNVVVTYTLPSCFKLNGTIAQNWRITTSENTVMAKLPSLAPGAQANFTIKVQVCCPAGQRLSTTATVESDTSQPQTSTASITIRNF